MIEFSNVSKSFWTGQRRKVILDRASLRVELGRSLGILAPNGTGKTTLINMMAGLEKPDEGEIRRYCRVSFPLGFMGGVVNRHSGTENARYIARLYGLDPDYVEAFARWLTGIEEYFDMPVGTYSQGMRARFCFSLMLALDFDVYLIDGGMPVAGAVCAPAIGRVFAGCLELGAFETATGGGERTPLRLRTLVRRNAPHPARSARRLCSETARETSGRFARAVRSTRSGTEFLA